MVILDDGRLPPEPPPIQQPLRRRSRLRRKVLVARHQQNQPPVPSGSPLPKTSYTQALSSDQPSDLKQQARSATFPRQRRIVRAQRPLWQSPSCPPPKLPAPPTPDNHHKETSQLHESPAATLLKSLMDSSPSSCHPAPSLHTLHQHRSTNTATSEFNFSYTVRATIVCRHASILHRLANHNKIAVPLTKVKDTCGTTTDQDNHVRRAHSRWKNTSVQPFSPMETPKPINLTVPTLSPLKSPHKSTHAHPPTHTTSLPTHIIQKLKTITQKLHKKKYYSHHRKAARVTTPPHRPFSRPHIYQQSPPANTALGFYHLRTVTFRISTTATPRPIHPQAANRAFTRYYCDQGRPPDSCGLTGFHSVVHPGLSNLSPLASH